jgi:hypothetical protein
VRSIKGFGENISQLSLCVNVSHLDISLFHMISQEVVSHFKVFHSFVEDHSKVSHGVHNPYDLGAAATYSASVVD